MALQIGHGKVLDGRDISFTSVGTNDTTAVSTRIKTNSLSYDGRTAAFEYVDLNFVLFVEPCQLDGLCAKGRVRNRQLLTLHLVAFNLREV